MHSPIRHTLAPIATAALLIGTLTGCTNDDPAEFETATEPVTSTPEGRDDGAAEGDDENEGEETETADGGAAAAGRDEEENERDGSASDGEPTPASSVRGPDEAIETITYDLPEDSAEVIVGLHTLRVEGEVMLLELSFTPQNGRGTYGFNNLNQGRTLMPLLNDRENLKQYSVLGSGGNRWASNTTVSGTRIENGQTIMYYAYYAAPEDDIDTINISVIDGLVEFTDAEIEW